MAAYLYNSGQLQPIDDVISDLKPDDIFPAIRDLQLFDGKRYGIGTALGISYYSFRKDLLPEGQRFVPPRTWEEYYLLLASIKATRPDLAPLLLPANDLHITLLFTELLASNNGSLFDAEGHPDFQNPRVIETLKYWKRLYELVPKDLRNSPYKENFVHYAQGRSFSLPCFFGRGLLQIERTAPEELRSPDQFSMFAHPIGPEGKEAFATLDSEPWVILKGSPNPLLGKEFIRFFYRADNYLDFCNSVPVHLTPIFQSLARSDKYRSLDLVKKWTLYYDYLLQRLDANEVLPIFMARTTDRFLPALFKLEGSRVVSGMVRDVTQNDLSAEEATRLAMAKAAEITQGLPERKHYLNLKNLVPPAWLIVVACGVLAIAAFYIRRRRNIER